MTDPSFFKRARSFTLSEIASLTGAKLLDGHDPATEISDIAPLDEGGEGRLIFIDSQRRRDSLQQTRATAILCPESLANEVPPGIAVLVSARPQADFATIARLLYPASMRPDPITGETGISTAAHVSPEAMIEPGAIIEAGAVIGPGAGIGSETVIAPHAVIGAGVQIGRQCYVGPGVSIVSALLGNRVIVHAGARLGQDGFGYVADGRGLGKIPQLGRVVVQDDVEIGANSTIDRGAMEDTVIGEGTKIDNLVQIAHNAKIGRHCAIAGQCGVSGSVKIGDGVLLGGGVGISDHVTVGNGARLAAGSGVIRDVPAGATWSGYPARPLRDFFREFATLTALAANRRKNGGR